MNRGLFSGLVMNKIIIQNGRQDFVYMLIREKSKSKRGLPNYVPAVYFIKQRTRFLTEMVLERIHPGCVVSIEYVNKSMKLKVPTPDSDREFVVKKQPFMVVTDIDMLYEFAAENQFGAIEELVSIVDDDLFKTVKQEDLEMIERLIEKKLEEKAVK